MQRAYFLAFAFLIVVDVAFLSPAIFTSAVRAPADITPHWPPFLADQPNPPPLRNASLQDWVVQFHPWQHMVRDSWAAGRVPLWNDRSGCGEPLLANLQCEALSPYLPLSFLTGDQYADWRQLAQLVVAQGFCLLLAAHLSLSAAAAAVTALAYAFSSYMQTWAVHPHAASASFAPGILWALLRVIARPTAWRFLGAAICVAFSVLAGHVETAAEAGLLAGGVALFCAIMGSPGAGRIRAAGLIAGAGVCGLLLAACVLLPFLDYESQSDSRHARKPFLDQRVPPAQLVTLFDLDAFGKATEPPTYHGAGNYPDGVLHVGVIAAGLAAAGIVIGIFRRTRLVVPLLLVAGGGILVACGPPEVRHAWLSIPWLGEIWPWRLLYIAILPIAVLGGIGLDEVTRSATGLSLRGRSAGAITIVLAAAVTSALPWYGYAPMAPATSLHPPSRALERLASRAGSGRTIELGGALPPGVGELYGLSRLKRYAAIGLRRLSEILEVEDGWFPIFGNGTDLTFAPPAILDALSMRWALSMYPATDSRFPMKPELIVAGAGTTVDRAAFSKVEGPIDVMIFRGWGNPLRDGTIDVVIGRDGPDLVWSLGPAGWTASEGEPPAAPDAPAVGEFQRTLPRGFPGEPFRIPRAIIDSSKSITFRMKGAAMPFWVTALLPGGVGTDVVEVESVGSLRIAERRSAMPLAYLSPGVTRVADEAAAAKLVRSASFDPHAATVVEAPAETVLPGGGPPAADDRATIVNRVPGAIDVEVVASADHLLVVTDAYARGWEATVDGRSAPIHPANLVGMSCRVPAGHHVVRLWYAPWSFIAGCATSVLTLLLLVAVAVRGAWRRRSAREVVVS
jgi:hypothetical protein